MAEALRAAGGDPESFEIRDPATDPRCSAYAEALHALRARKGMTEEAAAEAVAEPLTFAALAVRKGDADGTIGGAVHTTADTVRAALQIVGRAEGVRSVSSFFLMLLEEAHQPRRGALVFADGGLTVAPDEEGLAEIALASADSFAQLTGEEPRVAMLSFSTAGSAKHPRVETVRAATERVRAARPRPQGGRRGPVRRGLRARGRRRQAARLAD